MNIHCNHDCYEACADICLLYCAHAFMHIYICDVYIMFLYMYIFSRLWRFENKQINGIAWNWSNSVKILLLTKSTENVPLARAHSQKTPFAKSTPKYILAYGNWAEKESLLGHTPNKAHIMVLSLTTVSQCSAWQP